MWNEEKMKYLEEINNILFKVKSKNKNIIFIYTPPKVGSTSLVSSIRISASFIYSVVHIHDELMLNVLTGYKSITINDIILFNKIIGKNVFVIDIYRTPIERKISEYFEKISCYHFNNSEENLNTYPIEKIINRFNNIFPHLSTTDYYQEVYNINYPNSFNFETKYLLVEKDGINYIKLRLQDSKEWNTILSSLLKCEIIIVHDYETENKKIGSLYTKFKEVYTIPINLLEQIKSCPYINYYLSNEERNKYFSNWEKKMNYNTFSPYSIEEYYLYMNVCIENKYYNDFQSIHYMDVGCICRPCSRKREELFNRAKNGEKITEKIIHQDNVDNLKKNLLIALQNKIKLINQNYKKGKINKQSSTHLILKNIVGMKKS